MKMNKHNVKRSILFVLLGILISVVLITAFSWIVSDISAKMTYEAALSVKKNMLYEYVNNFIIYLDGECDQYLAAHPDADEEGYVTYPNVDTVTEMTNLIDATRSYEANVTAFNATKNMLLKGLDVGS